MTGHRRRSGRPLRAVATAQRSHDHLQSRLAAAVRPGHRVAAAAAYLLAVLRRADQDSARATAERAAATLINTATQLDAATTAAAVRKAHS